MFLIDVSQETYRISQDDIEYTVLLQYNLYRTIDKYYNFFPYFSLNCIANIIKIQF